MDGRKIFHLAFSDKKDDHILEDFSRKANGDLEVFRGLFLERFNYWDEGNLVIEGSDLFEQIRDSAKLIQVVPPCILFMTEKEKIYAVLSGSESHRWAIRKLVKEAAGDVERFKELFIIKFKKFDDKMLVNQAEKSRMDAINSGPELLSIT